MTSLYEVVPDAPAEGVATRRVTITVNGVKRTLDKELHRLGGSGGWP